MGTSVYSRTATYRGSRSVGGQVSVAPATAGDHLVIRRFLANVFQGPSQHEYKASLNDPFYEPRDRLLARCDGRIVGHAHLTHRVMQFGSLEIPVTGMAWLGVLPEVRGRGIGRRLLDAAEDQMAQDGSLVGLLRTRIPHFFRQTGWALCGRYCRSEAPARAVLRGLLDRGFKHVHRRRCRLNIRPWRRMEMPALARIYYQNLRSAFGSLQRTDAYWNWLVDRQAYDHLYVALDGPDLLELEENRSPIVGYAVTRADEIVEIQTAPDYQAAATHLLVRACGDVIERNHHGIVLHAPAGSRLHKLFRSAGGRQHHQESDRGEVLMARLLDPLELLRRMAPELRGRAEENNLPLPADLGLAVDGRKFHLAVKRKTIEVSADKIGRSHLKLNEVDFTRLLLGHLDWKRALAERRVQASTAAALETGRRLFPQLPLWRPPLDDLPA